MWANLERLVQVTNWGWWQTRLTRTKAHARLSLSAFKFQTSHGPWGHDFVICQTGDTVESPSNVDYHKHGIIYISQPLHEWLIKHSFLQFRIFFSFFPSLIHTQCLMKRGICFLVSHVSLIKGGGLGEVYWKKRKLWFHNMHYLWGCFAVETY